VTEIDVLVVGAGVTGLASALALSERGRSVCVLEAHARPGLECSTHNSGVIHAGLYYPPGSLKARLCVEGRDALYAFCASAGVPFRRTGKLVVAEDPAREAELETIAANARANGARADLWRREEIARREPAVKAAVGLWSPDTGIVDASMLVAALAGRLLGAGGAILPHTPLSQAHAREGGIEVETPREQITARVVVNAAGLFADDVSAILGGETFRIWPCRGDYAELTPRAAARFSTPIYPLPEPSGHGLGVHITPTTGGSVLLGPTARYQDSKTDYESNRLPLEAFLTAARKLMPDLELGDLREGGSGIRAKRHPADQRFADFMIQRDARQPRLVHAAGIDSPGLTSCLAIGRMVADLADEALG
jgi:L-2-hydroxyglutarate oxidase LhgO